MSGRVFAIGSAVISLIGLVVCAVNAAQHPNPGALEALGVTAVLVGIAWALLALRDL